jgi:hypothetical protein
LSILAGALQQFHFFIPFKPHMTEIECHAPYTGSLLRELHAIRGQFVGELDGEEPEVFSAIGMSLLETAALGSAWR